jgi:hypothetical protein
MHRRRRVADTNAIRPTEGSQDVCDVADVETE